MFAPRTMIKYTANYTYTNPNFVIQNLELGKGKSPLRPLVYVLKNILQRGFPTVMSKYLQKEIGAIHKEDGFTDRLLLVSAEKPHWLGTIRGDVQNNYIPARTFLEEIIPNELPDYGFIGAMLIPEIEINDIVGRYNAAFANQQVDFYLPQAKLVIEIDGQHHKQTTQRVNDKERDAYLSQFGIKTIRITTGELESSRRAEKLRAIHERISEFHKLFAFYGSAFKNASHNPYTEQDIKTKLLPTAVIRFELLFLDLILSGKLAMGKHWVFNILCDENIPGFAKLAIEDVYTWLNQLVLLRDKAELPRFDYEVKVSGHSDFHYDPFAINIDFSLLKRYTDENEMSPDTIFVRNDYFDYSEKRNSTGLDKNYFVVSTCDSINYDITDADKPALRFFLRNLFDKKDFRDGQYAIIANALNLRDTIGLLPTGGGKSLCYQLPCLLQPSINFVVCPIKSLMYDQSDNLRNPNVAITNINYISGDMSSTEKVQVMDNYSKGRYLFVWISPERFQIDDFRASLAAIVNDFNISYAVIDEVHCLSEWGHDFRTSYLNLAKTIDALSPKDEHGEGVIKYLGLTATASVNVLKDIRVEFSRRQQKLDDDNIKTLLDYSRKELVFKVIDDQGNKEAAIDAVFAENNIPFDKSKATLIFTPVVNGKKGCYQLANRLMLNYPDQVAWFAGQCPKDPVSKQPIMSQGEFDKFKVKVQEDFKADKYQVLCATKAFGMGIDKQNVFYTIHYGLPSSVEALYQEAGRAGRWDKSLPENKGKRGLCYVLHSHEMPKIEPLVSELFSPATDVTRMKDIQDQVGFDGRDIFTQMFLFMNGVAEIRDEFSCICSIIDNYFKPGASVTIYYEDLQNVLFMSPDTFEKEIYRLCLLGVADDWTRDFVSYFTVSFRSVDDAHVVQALSSYINKYDPDEDVKGNIEAVTEPACDTFLKKAIWYLLDWIFRHITENRKQTLKTLSDWCLEFTDSESFKKRIDAYFTFNESTFILQHVAEHSDDFATWFETFYSNKRIITRGEFSKLRDRLSRFLEGYHNSPGLNFVSGFVRLYLNSFDDPDGRQRFESALQYVKTAKENGKDIQPFFDGLFKLADDAKLSSDQLMELALAVQSIFPEMQIKLADEFNLPQLCTKMIEEKVAQIRNINIELYEQIGRL